MEDQRHRATLLEQQDERIRERERDREREREQRERESERANREPYPPSAPHHSNAGSIPIHQPVANRFPGTIHSPGGLLANHGANPTSVPLGAPSGPGGPPGAVHGDSNNRQLPHGVQNGAASSQHQMFAPAPHGSMPPNGPMSTSGGAAAMFGPPLQPDGGRGPPQPVPFGAGMATGHALAPVSGNTMNQGQQPILNDALSYLDQVKVQFSEQPDVYNRFLDIMKDFKSQTIDTPGVISRVSELFAGHPNLIQGFNTFLPPGYRIECGLENNPNSIRVTTPSGSTIHSIGPGRAVQIESGPPPSSVPRERFAEQRPPNWQGPVQHSIESPEVQFSTPAQSGHGPMAHGSAQSAPFDAHSPVQQRGQPPAQASSATSHPPVPRNALTPTPAAVQALNGAAAQSQANMEKRGPVEFNHAISYVNKIKNRFQDKPEIYKQFLEILQTYQREQKPIQDVYAQVTTLFNAAPDLLEDFKQFLPESAAQTRGAAQRAEEFTAMTNMASTPQPGHTARDGPKGPPVGNFAPPASTSKESKKRARPDKQAGPPTSAPVDPPTSNMRGAPASASNKRLKTTHPKPGVAEGVEPNLTPCMPVPLAPTSPTASADLEIAFFDKAKKFINNKTAFSEFLKLCNMFTQELLDKDDLIAKASQFIGGHTELFGWFKEFVSFSGEDHIIEQRPEPATGRVSLSNCRSYGPSYRLLPKRERLKPCSGRDDLCNSVLNDEWASHPTWASEDSGFVAHRKNAFEEGLHRIEEERHDYDFYIEANQKCIQLLEPIAQQMLTLTPNDRANFRMPTGLGGHSQSIYKRVLKKVYGPEHGPQAVNDMFSNPFSVVPVVLARLKQKDEEWRFSQREWERVWQTQTETIYLRSLDHMGLSIRNNDKRTYSAKHLVDVIKTKHEEQKRMRSARHKIPHYQFQWNFEDKELILDLLRLMFMYAMNSGQHGATEKERILDFFETFIPQFFDLPEDKVLERLANIDRDSGDEDAEEIPPTELTNGRSGRRNGRKSDLLRGVLDPGRNGSKPRNHKEGSAASGSKETTPDVASGNEEEMPDAPEDASAPEVGSNDRWLATAPVPTVASGDNSLLDEQGDLKADGSFPRPWFNFFCNQTIYVFFSILQTVYQRLKGVKDNKESVLNEIRREKLEKPAKVLGLVQDDLKFFSDLPEDKFWSRTLELIEDFINSDIDENRYQDVLRHYYLSNGWQLYTIQDLLKTLCRLALVCNNTDNKDKTPDLIKQYILSRQHDETSYQVEISHRKFAEKCIKDGEMFVITWIPGRNEATVRWLQKDDTTFHMDEMELRDRWQYYISSWMRTEPTEGVSRARMQKVVLTRNLPSGDADSDGDYQPKAISYSEGLVLKICLNTSKISYAKGTSNYFIYNIDGGSAEQREEREQRRQLVREVRNQKFTEKMAMNSPWMKNLSQEQVQHAKEAYEKWKTEGIPPAQDDE